MEVERLLIMEILIQGSGAADGVPAFLSNSRVCEYARAHGGKDIRTRCGALIDGHLKLDFGPDTFSQVARDKVVASDWTGIVFTHSHEDHITISELQYMLFSFTPDLFAPATLYGNAVIESKVWERYPDWPFEFIQTRSFESFDHLGYRITPIAAHHKLDEDCHNLLIEHEGKTFLYGTDTGVWHEPTWEFLTGVKIDALVIESTDGKVKSGYHGHLSLDEAVQVTNRLREIGTLASTAPVFTTHHCHYGDATHAELEELLAPHQMAPAYDGLRILL